MAIRKLFYFLLALSYAGLGVFVWYNEIVPQPWNLLFGIACILIAGLRLYRGIKLETP